LSPRQPQQYVIPVIKFHQNRKTKTETKRTQQQQQQ